MVNPLITTEVIQADEFPEVSRRYEVSGVPKAVINDRIQFVGAAPESFVIERILSVNR
jgi:predicted DsbA family dithiol-disulfide isomerase